MTLEDLLRTTEIAKTHDGRHVEVSTDFRIAVQRIDDGCVRFLVYAAGVNTETQEFSVEGNTLSPIHMTG